MAMIGKVKRMYFRQKRSVREIVAADEFVAQHGTQVAQGAGAGGVLIDRLSKRIGDAGVIRLIRAYLNSGIRSDQAGAEG